MRRAGSGYLLLALTLVSSYWLLSQEPPIEKRKDLCTLQGRTVNLVSGEPLGSISLTLRALPPGTDSENLSSGADGRFSFEDLAPGSYILSAYRRGGQAEVYRPSDGASLTLSAGQVLNDIEFKLTPLGEISGTVVDENAEPVPRSIVSAQKVGQGGGSTATTNEAGNFRFAGLAPGNYVLLAAAPGDLLATYYPSAADASGAIPLQVAPGQEIQGITIVLREGRLNPARYHIRGRAVALSQDTPVADVRLQLSPRLVDSGMDAGTFVIYMQSGTVYPIRASLAKNGSFDFGGVRPGSYYLTASRRGETELWLGWEPVDVIDADVAGVVLRLREPIQVPGTIKMEGEDEANLAGIRIEPSALGGPRRNSAKAWVDPGNTFTLENVAPGRYRLNVIGLPDGAYVKSVRLGGGETIDSGLDLPEMRTAAILDILISPNGATIEGTVRQGDGKAVPGAWVCLIPERAHPELTSRIGSAKSGGDGKFALKGVAPGDYRLYAFEQPQPVPLLNIEFFKPFEGKAVKLTVKEGEEKQADPKTIKLGS